MTGGQKRLIELLATLKKLPAARQQYWVGRLEQIARTTTVGTLVDETGKPVDVNVPWYQGIADLWDEGGVAAANELDAIYRAISDEAKKVASTAADVASSAGFSLWPLAIAAVAFAWAWSKKG